MGYKSIRSIGFILCLAFPQMFFGQQPQGDSPTAPKATTEKYKLIFANLNEDDTAGFGPPGFRGTTRILRDLINQWTRSGYRLQTFLLPFALVGVDPGGYEYNVFFNTDDVISYFRRMNFRGYQIFTRSSNGNDCDVYNDADGRPTVNCESRDIYLTERTVADPQELPQILVTGPLYRTDKHTMTKIDGFLANGYRPLKALPAGIIVEKPLDPGELLKNHTEYRVSTSNHDEIRQLGSQGFRIVSMDNSYAIMKRDDSTRKVPVRYIWLQADKQHFRERLNEMEQLGARFMAITADRKGRMNKMAFEAPSTAGSTRISFKLLQFGLEKRIDSADGKPFLDLTAEGRKSLAEMELLANEGYF